VLPRAAPPASIGVGSFATIGAAKAGAARPQRAAGAVGPAGRLPCASRACGPPQLSERSERSERSEFCGATSARASQGSRSIAPTATPWAAAGCRPPRRA